MIKIKNLNLKLGKREIFSGFNLEIARGEKVGIIGGEPSTLSGKTAPTIADAVNNALSVAVHTIKPVTI